MIQTYLTKSFPVNKTLNNFELLNSSNNVMSVSEKYAFHFLNACIPKAHSAFSTNKFTRSNLKPI